MAGTYTLPAGRQYARLVAAVDMDGDRSSEVLLEGAGYNMGQLVLSLEAVKLTPNNATSIVQKVPEVYVDACENPKGAKDRSAKTISLKNGRLEASVKDEACGRAVASSARDECRATPGAPAVMIVVRQTIEPSASSTSRTGSLHCLSATSGFPTPATSISVAI